MAAYAKCQTHVNAINPQVLSSNCIQFTHPREPYLTRGSVKEGYFTGTAYPNERTLNGNSILAGTTIAIPTTMNASTGELSVQLPHSFIQVHLLNSNGGHLLEIYVYTKSEYAPNGDSGTFTLNSQGHVVQGSAVHFASLKQEIFDADPTEIEIARGFWRNLGSDILRGGFCFGVGAMDGALVAGLFDGATEAAFMIQNGLALVIKANEQCFP